MLQSRVQQTEKQEAIKQRSCVAASSSARLFFIETQALWLFTVLHKAVKKVYNPGTLIG
jgi:hypothetical protein